MAERAASPNVVQTLSINGFDPNRTPTLGDLLSVRERSSSVFAGRCHAGAPGRVMGGQVAAKALAAAGRTVDADRTAHSLHGYFLREGRPDQDIDRKSVV